MDRSELTVLEGGRMDKKQALEQALAQIDKAFGKGSIMRLGANDKVDIEAISTGSLGLDIALGIGGLPKGRIIQHTLRAPIAGTLGGVVPLQPGGVLTRGTVVAGVIPDDRLRVVARFTPASVGRIRPGQPFRLRLDGVPWTEFGSLVGAVWAFASETQDSLVRVECELDAHQAARIPVEHGLVGVVEVTVETVSPASLLLRTVGQLLAP